MFASQPHFAKPKFSSHILVRICLVFVTIWLDTLYCIYDSFIREFGFNILNHPFVANHILACRIVARNYTGPTSSKKVKYKNFMIIQANKRLIVPSNSNTIVSYKLASREQ
jgi:hypothetical protein